MRSFPWGGGHAATFTYNGLSSDDTTDIIVNSIDNIEYLRFDILADLTFAQTLAATSLGGAYNTYDIAGITQVEQFFDALFVTSPCGPVSSFTRECGDIPTWFDGAFGDDWTANDDYFFSKDGTGGAAASWFRSVGTDTGLVRNTTPWGTIAESDIFSAPGASSDTISWLVFRDIDATQPPVTPVPEPSIIALLGFGLLGGFRVAQRRERG